MEGTPIQLGVQPTCCPIWKWHWPLSLFGILASKSTPSYASTRTHIPANDTEGVTVYFHIQDLVAFFTPPIIKANTF